jgi:hypothetical protein
VIKQIAKSTLDLHGRCDIKFLAMSAFNKLYEINCDDKQVVFRVTLLVDPKWKPLSEVATLQWVAQNTKLPVPRALAYNIDRGNPVGFEWIIMDKMPGKTWADAWQELSFNAKSNITRQVALFCADTFEKQFTCIGNLFSGETTLLSTDQLPSESSNPSSIASDSVNTGKSTDMETYAGSNKSMLSTFQVQRIVSTSLMGRGPCPDEGRGPFATSREWLSTRLDFAEFDCRQRLKPNSQSPTHDLENEVLVASEVSTGDNELNGRSTSEGNKVIVDFESTGNQQEQEFNENNFHKTQIETGPFQNGRDSAEHISEDICIFNKDETQKI